MLKINLLPRRVRDRRRVPRYALVCGLIFAALVIGFGFVVISLRAEVSNLDTEVRGLAQKAAQVQALEAEVVALQQEAQLAQNRVDFIRAVQDTGPAWADYIEQLGRWLPSNAYLDSWSIDGGTVTWQGKLRVADPARGMTTGEYLLFQWNIERCPMISGATVTVDGLGVYAFAARDPLATAGQESVPFSVGGTLVGYPQAPAFQPVQVAVPAAAAQPGAAASVAGAAMPSPEALGEEEGGEKATGKKGKVSKEEKAMKAAGGE